jgi:glucan phosphoethanolaminetransferase (alkaline phosphatase superfamily)
MEEVEKKQTKTQEIIIGVNLLILIVYTIYLRVDSNNYNFIADAFFIAIHVVLCLVIAIFIKPRAFLLSAGLVLLIGFATCFAIVAK